MKIIITEQQLNNTIEKTLKQLYPNIVSVSFQEKPISYYGDKEYGKFTRTYIRIVLDLGKVLEGNIYITGNVIDEHDIKKDIINTLKNYLNIDIKKFKSPYEVILYTLTTTPV